MATQLELGIRMLDVDTIYTKKIKGCSGLETGHGNNLVTKLGKTQIHRSLNHHLNISGLYQCYGQVDELLEQVADWLNQHPTELVMIHFGDIEYPEEAVPKLVEALKLAFPEVGNQVKMNKDFKAKGFWPLLGEAVDKNERVFVFIRDTVGVLDEDDLQFVKEIKVKPDKALPPRKSKTEVYVTSSYKAKHVTDCSYLLETSHQTCHSEMLRPTDFLTLSLFSGFGGGFIIQMFELKLQVWQRFEPKMRL